MSDGRAGRTWQYTKPRSDLVGQDFGYWHVLAWAGWETYRSGGQDVRCAVWLCRCVCGTERQKNSKRLSAILREGGGSCGCRTASSASRPLGQHSNWTGCGGISGTFWCSIRKDAVRRGIPFEIDIGYAWQLFRQQAGRCELTGQRLTFTGGRRRGTASLDRIDNDCGYVEGNVQWLHKDINRMKHTHSTARFIELCAMVAKHNGDRHG